MPEYTVIADGALMYHLDRQRAYERTCYGCQQQFTTKWPHGAIVAVITDRSGSEWATAHNDDGCIEEAATLLLDEEADEYRPWPGTSSPFGPGWEG